MKNSITQISILSAVFFIPSALIISGFFYFTTAVFQEQIYVFDDSALKIADEVFGQQVGIFGDEIYDESIIFENEGDFIEYVEYADPFIDEGWIEYGLLLDTLEQATYNSAISSLLPVLYGVLFLVFLLSVTAALVMIRPLRLALEKQKQFIADASHEIKTPLALMQSEVELFEKEHQDKTPSHKNLQIFTTNIRSDISRLSSLAERLLRLARLDGNLENSQQTVQCSPSQITKELEQLVNRFSASNPNHNLSLVTGDWQQNASVSCERLKQVFEVLLENACVHTPTGTEVVTETTAEKNQLVVTVHDNGEGISRHHIEHVFDRFYRVDDSRHGKGNGLGLSIARDLVEQDRGVIDIESTADTGTLLTVKYLLL